MRIVGGDFKGRALIAPEGNAVRPTTDRVREAIFNVLAHSPLLPKGIEGTRILDLFAGTGALGLEALSRGADFSLFVENAGSSRAVIRRNIEALGLTGKTKVFRRDATDLGPLPAGIAEPFDIVFLDPPYKKGLGPLALQEAHKEGWLTDNACVVLEISAKEDMPDIEGFTCVNVKRYGDTQVAFLLFV